MADDVDADGREDLPVGGFEDVWHAALGAGAFGPAQSLGFADTFSLADADGDGDPDLAWADASNELGWRANAAGAFGPLAGWEILGATSAIYLTDLDGDGTIDGLSCHDLPFAGSAAVRWPPGAVGPVEALRDGVGIQDCAVADLDGDGNPEVVYVADDPNEVALVRVLGLDTDDDGLTDADELDLGTDPGLADTDADGLADGDEIGLHGTDPVLADTDGDGLLDGDEVDGGSDPLATEHEPHGRHRLRGKRRGHRGDRRHRSRPGDPVRDRRHGGWAPTARSNGCSCGQGGGTSSTRPLSRRRP